MRFDIHIRQSMRDRLADVSARMALWDQQQPASPDLHRRLVEAIEPFEHTTHLPGLLIGGVDGSGDFPAVAYADSFVYASVASGALYETDSVHGLKEVDRGLQPLVEFTWLATSEQQRAASMLESFERLVGRSVDEVLDGSDYRDLSRGGRRSAAAQRSGLIIPPAHDAGNVGIQLRTTAELAAALKLIDSVPDGSLVLTDGTMSLPFVQRDKFGALDYSAHDQRCYGYPYPIKAAHDRGSLTEQERTPPPRREAEGGAGRRPLVRRSAGERAGAQP